jgi:FkbM family methyltransferase
MIPRFLVDRIPPRARVAKRALLGWMHGEPELHLATRLCAPSEIAIDVGANTGVYAWHLARRAAAVIAFEPQPDLAAFLRAALGRNVRVEEVALSDTAGEAILRVPSDRMATGRATIEAANALEEFEAREVRVTARRLDDYGLRSVGLIKIDVEGHELAVIDGAEALLARERPNLIVEAEDRHRTNAPAAVRARLADFGYRGFIWRNGALTAIDDERALIGCRTNNFVFIARPEVRAALDLPAR